MTENKRVYYAIQAVAAEPIDSSGIKLGQKLKLQGLQSVTINSKFDLESVNQFGTLEIYDTAIKQTDIEISLTKVIDNKPPLYLLLTQGSQGDSNNKNIYELGPRRSDIYIGIWPDTFNMASGTPIQTILCSGTAISSVEYNLTTDSLTESITLQSSNKKFANPNNTSLSLPAQNPQGEPPDTVKIAARYSLDFLNSILPTGQGGITGNPSDLRLRSINIKCDIERDKIYQLGSMTPAIYSIINPTTITCSIETIMSSDEFTNFHRYNNKQYIASLVNDEQKHPVLYDIKFPPDPDNNWWKGGTVLKGPNGNEQFCTTEIPEHTFSKNIIIKIKNCNDISKNTATDTDDLYIDLGKDNRIQSIDYTGDTSGENIIIRYNFINYNDFVVRHGKVGQGGRYTAYVVQ